MTDPAAFPTRYAAELAGLLVDAYAEFEDHGRVTLPPGWALIGEFSGTSDFHVQERFGFVARREQRVVVALRGTDSLVDVLSDLDVRHVRCPFPAGRSRCARGDERIYASLRQEMHTLVQKAQQPGDELWVAGHSLGAAMATIATLDLALHGESPPHLIAIAPTRVGDPVFGWWFRRHVPFAWRVQNPHDLVPKQPPWWFGYRHVGKLHRVHFPHAFGPLENHAIASYRKALLRQAGEPPRDPPPDPAGRAP